MALLNLLKGKIILEFLKIKKNLIKKQKKDILIIIYINNNEFKEKNYLWKKKEYKN